MRALAVVALALATAVGTTAASPALAAEPVALAHEERVEAGPYELVLGFSEWPLTEARSFDLLVDPAGGIADKSATVEVLTPTGEQYFETELGRFPRQRESWGLDVVAFTGDGEGGRWSVLIDVDGPQGRGTGRAVLPLQPRQGPPDALNWSIAALPALLLVGAVAAGWWRLRGARRGHAWALGAEGSQGR